jgi:molybdenum cofactor guanylyltransferase
VQETCAVVILAGGEGRRLGNVDKALVMAAGQPLLAHSLARLRPQAQHIVLSANGATNRFAAFELPVVADAVPDAGPLAGIAATAAYCATRWPTVRALVTIPVDVPRPPPDLVERLVQPQTSDIVVAEADGRRQWAIARWPLAAALALAEPVNAGLRRMEEAIQAVGYTTVSFAQVDAFHNINTPDDLAQLERTLTQI